MILTRHKIRAVKLIDGKIAVTCSAFDQKPLSLLGLFLNAPLHFTKKAPIKPKETPFWKPQFV